MSTVRNKNNAPRFYEVKKPASHFVGEITKLLTEYGAGSFMVENGPEGIPAGIAFQLEDLAYRVRPDVEAMSARLERAKRKGKAPPSAVAWAQARHLLELQLEAIETGSARASEVLGGYVMMRSGQTVGEVLEARPDELMAGERLMLPSGPS